MNSLLCRYDDLEAAEACAEAMRGRFKPAPIEAFTYPDGQIAIICKGDSDRLLGRIDIGYTNQLVEFAKGFRTGWSRSQSIIKKALGIKEEV
jgi:hypothetical protein